MQSVFIYSDEVGEYRPRDRLRRPTATPSFFVRVGLSVPASSWRALRDAVDTAKGKLGVGPHKEIKWAECWSAIIAKRRGHSIKPSKPHAYLASFSEADIYAFLDNAIREIATVEGISFFFIVSKSDWTRHSERHIERWQLQNFLQRAQQDVKGRASDALGTVFFDPIEKKVESRLRYLYNELYHRGALMHFTNLMDSLNFQDSAHSVGIQAADLSVGCFCNALEGRIESKTLFYDCLRRRLRYHPRTGHVKGVGIVSVPRGAAEAELRTNLGVT